MEAGKDFVDKSLTSKVYLLRQKVLTGYSKTVPNKVYTIPPLGNIEVEPEQNQLILPAESVSTVDLTPTKVGVVFSSC